MSKIVYANRGVVSQNWDVTFSNRGHTFWKRGYIFEEGVLNQVWFLAIGT